MHARTTTIQAQTSSIDDGIAHVRDTVMPALENMDGFIGDPLGRPPVRSLYCDQRVEWKR